MSYTILDNANFWRLYHADWDWDPVEEGNGDVMALVNMQRVHIPFECGARYRLELEVTLDTFAIELVLVRKSPLRRLVLGWWDTAHWHPFALRWEELTSLLEHWDANPGTAPERAKSFLLLACFVGIDADDDDFTRKKLNLFDTYDSMGLFTHDEAVKLGHRALFDAARDDHKWIQHADGRWTYGEGAEDPACSLRQGSSQAGEKGFPFADFDELLRDIGAAGS